jgi:Ca-activated chloride channel homolog
MPGKLTFSGDKAKPGLRTGALLMLLPTAFAFGQNGSSRNAAQVRVPDRAPTAVFKGQQGKQSTEIHFDPASGLVTIKLLVQDPSGYFIPNIRRENFVVYENGVRQNNASCEVEHAPVSIALLLEYGGRSPGLNKVIAEQVTTAGRRLLDVLGPEDKLAVWKYADGPELLADFSQDHDRLKDLFYTLKPPDVSEANLYDALLKVSERMGPVAGRKAIILVSSGVDTFSKAKFEDVLGAIRHSSTPIYAIGLGTILHEAADVPGTVAPSARFDWKRSENELQEIARTAGGRFYSPTTIVDLSAIYDDAIENLKVRYVISYKSSTAGDLNSPRTIRVELENPKTGGPLKIAVQSGRTIQAHVIVQDSYTPSKSTGPQASLRPNLDRGVHSLKAKNPFAGSRARDASASRTRRISL